MREELAKRAGPAMAALDSALTAVLRLAEMERRSLKQSVVRERVLELVQAKLGLRPPVLTAEVIEAYTELGVDIAVRVGNQTVWIVHETTEGKDRIELTPKAMGFLLLTQEALGGKIVEVKWSETNDGNA